jgi:hypothetical protein
MFQRYFLLQSYQLAEETFLLTSKKDKVKRPSNEVMKISTQASEMRHARNNRVQNRRTPCSNSKALPFYINAQLRTNIK